MYQATAYPEAAASYAGVTFPGERIYTIDSWGGYLAYRFPARRIVFLYDEPAVFGSDALQLYDDINQLDPSWVHVLGTETSTTRSCRRMRVRRRHCMSLVGGQLLRPGEQQPGDVVPAEWHRATHEWAGIPPAGVPDC